MKIKIILLLLLSFVVIQAQENRKEQRDSLWLSMLQKETYTEQEKKQIGYTTSALSEMFLLVQLLACEEGYPDLKENIETLKKKIPEENVLSFNEKPEVKKVRECFKKEPIIEHSQCVNIIDIINHLQDKKYWSDEDYKKAIEYLMITSEIHPILDREIGKCIPREEEQE